MSFPPLWPLDSLLLHGLSFSALCKTILIFEEWPGRERYWSIIKRGSNLGEVGFVI